ncbi:MAG: hypothetical protein HFF36_06255 [Coprobacillus sp.]|nr:hypothetical protein [Coprobacillus sp.]
MATKEKKPNSICGDNEQKEITVSSTAEDEKKPISRDEQTPEVIDVKKEIADKERENVPDIHSDGQKKEGKQSFFGVHNKDKETRKRKKLSFITKIKSKIFKDNNINIKGFNLSKTKLDSADISYQILINEDLFQNIKQKKGLLRWTKWLCAIQLIILNIMVIYITFYQFCILPNKPSILQLHTFNYTKVYNNFYEFLKVFMGATFVELIGIIGIIVKSVFNKKIK